MAGQTHKIAKGETLEGIAKRYKSDAKAVWAAPENRALVARRGKPESLQPGDLLVIPADPKAQKAADAQAERLRQGRDAALALLAALEKENARIERRIATYQELIQVQKDATVQIVKELTQTLAKMKGFADGVDAAATVAQLMVSLGKITAKGYQASKASGEALEKLNKELLKDVVGMPVDQFKDVGIKLGSELKDRANSPLGYVGVLADSWQKMTSPSFWANTFVQVTQNQKSWSQAVAMDVGDDIKQRIQEVAAEGQNAVARLTAQLAQARSQLPENARLIAECKARLRWCEQEVAKLPRR